MVFMAGSLKWFKAKDPIWFNGVATKIDESNGEIALLGFQDFTNSDAGLPIMPASKLGWIEVSNSIAGRRRLPVANGDIVDNADTIFAGQVITLPVITADGSAALLPFTFTGNRGKGQKGFNGKQFPIGTDTGLIDGDNT